ncbi:MAG: Flp pilus assembly protein CpaB [Gammaproteobacteria bacterium]|jgi:pilus assembly protein CpaB
MWSKIIGSLAAWWLVPVAVLCGLAAFVGSQRHLAERAAAVERRWEERYTPVKVLVAARDLPSGRVLRESDLARREMPAAFVPGGALSVDAAARAVGQQLVFALRRGDALVEAHLAGREGPTLAARLQRGTRAVTVPVDEVSSQAGLVRPGDRIDLMLAEERAEETGRCVIVRPLLEAVSVLATGRTQRPLPGTASALAAGYGDPGASPEYSTITLDVTPEQAQLLAVGLRIGELVPLLRPEGDGAPSATVASNGRTACSAATLATPVVPAARRPSARSVEGSLELLVGGVDAPSRSLHRYTKD